VNNFTQRALTGAVFVLILVGAILFNAYTYLALFLLITLGGTWEFYGLIGKGETGRGIPKLPGTIVSGGIFVLSALIASGKLLHVFWLLLLPLTGFVFIAELYRKYEKPFINIAFTFLGLIYVCLPFSILSFLAFNQSGEYDPQLVMGFFILLWCSDTGAYIAGKTMGRHKLFERISPKKTWEA
jgi:phosphatidate cytidylyltransferase